MSVKIEVFGKQVKINGRHAADAICEATARTIARALENYFRHCA
jgi:hypothetical protein